MLLLAIALVPLFAPHFWHRERNRAAVTAALAVPVAIYLLALGPATNGRSTARLANALEEYASFILMLTALYTVAGGIVLRGTLPATPRANTMLLATGAVLANFVGTTGASMVLIRPVLRANAGRLYRAHVPVFFIFIVSNAGGLLTPLGDPPLFLGFIKGVGFFWTLTLWQPWLLANAALLTIFYLYDRRMLRREAGKAHPAEPRREPLKLAGLWPNGVLMFGVIAAVMAQAEQFNPVGSELGRLAISAGGMALMTGLSLRLTPRPLRAENRFAWGPIVEVAVLFAGIFVTMAPVLALLEVRGAAIGVTEPWEFFWLTGLLSSLLDNAPTYLTFGTLAAQGNDFAWLAANRPDLLAAVSCGAVLMGANTYIGNGPNFMVKAIADAQGYRTPSFFGFFRYSGLVLLPVFVLVTLAFFR
jgi:Na+/H+ antiporter NhaD/arsenite permease-like protein